MLGSFFFLVFRSCVAQFFANNINNREEKKSLSNIFVMFQSHNFLMPIGMWNIDVWSVSVDGLFDCVFAGIMVTSMQSQKRNVY